MANYRIRRAFVYNGVSLQPGDEVELEGRNLEKMIELRYVTPLEDGENSDSQPVKRGPGRPRKVIDANAV